MSALKSTQPADEPTKIQTASELVKLERKTLSSEVSASVDARKVLQLLSQHCLQASNRKRNLFNPEQERQANPQYRVWGGIDVEALEAGTKSSLPIWIWKICKTYHLKIWRNWKNPSGSGISGNVNLKDVLGKLKFGKIDLKKIRKRGKLSKEKTNNAVEVVSKNAALFAAGKSKIRDKIKPMSLFQYREYLMKVDPILRQKWKIPLKFLQNWKSVSNWFATEKEPSCSMPLLTSQK